MLMGILQTQYYYKRCMSVCEMLGWEQSGYCGSHQNTPTPAMSDSIFVTYCLWLETRLVDHAFQVYLLESTLMLQSKHIKVRGFSMLVQCLITITGDGCVSIRPSSSAGEREADYLSQQPIGQHCGNSRQVGPNWGRER